MGNCYWHQGLNQQLLLKGGLTHSSTNTDNFVVGFRVYWWSHVGLVPVCTELHQQQCSPLSLFLHVCSMCSSHISANIYIGCKALLISFPCLLSCSFSHTDVFSCWLRVTAGTGQESGECTAGRGASECNGRSGENPWSKERGRDLKRGQQRREHSPWWMACHPLEIKSPISHAIF